MNRNRTLEEKLREVESRKVRSAGTLGSLGPRSEKFSPGYESSFEVDDVVAGLAYHTNNYW